MSTSAGNYKYVDIRLESSLFSFLSWAVQDR